MDILSIIVRRLGSIEVDEVFQTLQSDKEDLWDQILFSQQLLGVVDRNHDGHMEFQVRALSILYNTTILN